MHRKPFFNTTPRFGGRGGTRWSGVVPHETPLLAAICLSVYEPIAIKNFAWGTVPKFGRGVELGGQVWYPLKVLHIKYKLFAWPNCYLSPFTSQSQYKVCLGDRPPIWGGVELWGWVWNPVKLLHIRYTVFAGTEMLSLFVYELIAIQILLGGLSPQFGGRGGVGDRMW